MSDSIMLETAKDFAVDIVNLCRTIKETKRERSLSDISDRLLFFLYSAYL